MYEEFVKNLENLSEEELKRMIKKAEEEDSKDSYLMDSEFIGMGSIAIDAPKS